jgi:predicted metal-dependent HD superfamily phosphohydrolase
MTDKPGKYGIEGFFKLHWLRPGYRKTMSGLSARPPEQTTLVSDGDTLRFSRYPFEPASIYPDGSVACDAIAEINIDCPSQVRLKSGEILFVSNAPSSKEALLTFINRTDVKVQRRISVWSTLLDPFLDTWVDQTAIDKQFEWFAKQGLNREVVDSWRKEVADAMVAYNFGTGLWEWVSLSLHDALLAQQARLSQRDFADFYRRAMDLTRADPCHENMALPGDETIGSALHSVLLGWYPREKVEPEEFSAEYDRRSKRVTAMQQRLADELASAYSEPHRRYHSIGHVEHCLKEVGHVWDFAVNLDEIRWALLFHDAIYDPRRQDNEALSADWACKVMDELQRPKEQQERVREMILATAHAGRARTPDEALLLDIDLSILGANEHVFDDYDRAIREEYAWVPEADYRQARTKVLESFLKRDPIYQTSIGRERYGARARANLERALARLRERCN